MAIIGAYALPHPPLAIPDVGRGDEERIRKTLTAYDEVAKEIANLKPETIIYITPHNVNYADYFHISPGLQASGDLSRFNASHLRFTAKYDTELSEAIAREAKNNGIPAGFDGEKDSKLDHGVMVPMYFINRCFSEYRTIRISQSGMDSSRHYLFGQLIARAAEQIGRRIVIVASGDLSHKLTSSGPYGFAPEGALFDESITKAFSSGDFLSLFNISDQLRQDAAECGYNSFMILAGCFDGLSIKSILLSYEGPFGVGYAVAGFSPDGSDTNRNFLDQYEQLMLAESKKHQDSEDAYCSLARQSLTFAIQNGRTLQLPDDLPEEMLKNKAGAFVSLHKNGHLRGCVGTIAPTTDNIALEIIQNALSAGLSDNRFEPVNASELPFITYKVDILSAPEQISSPDELDPKRYGVIVTSGLRRGLLLPNLEGIDSVEEQIAIARKKGGIRSGATIKLERFEVCRHE